MLLEAMIGHITLDTHYRHTHTWVSLAETWLSQEEENWTKNLQMASNTELRTMIKTKFSGYKMFCFSLTPPYSVCVHPPEM